MKKFLSLRLPYSKQIGKILPAFRDFSVGFIMANAGIFGELSPFGLSWAASNGESVKTAYAFCGAALGYALNPNGFKYLCALTLTGTFRVAFRELSAVRTVLFATISAVVSLAAVGSVFLVGTSFSAEKLLFFLSELALTAAGSYFFRDLFSPKQSSAKRRSGLIAFVGVIAASLCGIVLFSDVRLGRIFAGFVLLCLAKSADTALICTSSVALGLMCDAATSTGVSFTAIYAVSALTASAWNKKSRISVAVVFVITNAAMVFVAADPGIAPLYETFAASVLFILFCPYLDPVLAWLAPASEHDPISRLQTAVSDRIVGISSVFSALRTAIPAKSDADCDQTYTTLRAAIDRTCRGCPLRGSCWEQDYLFARDALRGAAIALHERGCVTHADLPKTFRDHCAKAESFLNSLNDEHRNSCLRTQLRARENERNRAVIKQYADLEKYLFSLAHELNDELSFDLAKEEAVKEYLFAQNHPARVSVYYTSKKHLCVDLRLEFVENFEISEHLPFLSKILGTPVIAEQSSFQSHTIRLFAAPPLDFDYAFSMHRRQNIAGDCGVRFTTHKGLLYLAISDGMGTGAAAASDSGTAVRLAEHLIRSGMDHTTALSAVNTALFLKNDNGKSFATVDLFSVNLYSGKANFSKLGAAPSYLVRDASVRKIEGTALPAGLAGNATLARCEVRLLPGDTIVLCSDGICEGGDFLPELLSKSVAQPAKELANLILRTAKEKASVRDGRYDDMTVMVLRLTKRESNQPFGRVILRDDKNTVE